MTKQQLFVPTKTPSYIAITRRPRFFRIGEWWVISTTTQRLLCGTILASSSDTTFFPWGNFYISFQVVSVEVGCRMWWRVASTWKSFTSLVCHLVTKPLNRWRRSSYAAQLPWWLYPVPSFLSCFLVLNDDCSRLCKTKFISIGTSLNHLSLFNHKHIYCRKKERRRAIYLWWVCRVWEEIDSGYEDQYSFLKIRWSSGWSYKSC